MSGLSAMKSNLSTEKTPFPAISWYIEGGLLNRFMKLKHSHLGWKKDQVILLAIFWSVVGLYVVDCGRLTVYVEAKNSLFRGFS